MKNVLKILSLLMVLVLALSVFAACGNNVPTVDNTTAPSVTDGPTEDGKVKVYWCQGQKILKEEDVNVGSLVSDWVPTVAGKEFIAWYSNPGCTTEFDFTKPITKETEIFASFKTVSGGGVVDDVEPADYYLMGTGKGSLKYASWQNHNVSAIKVGMSEVSGGKYTITIDFYAGDAFQICTGGNWDAQMGLGCIPGAVETDNGTKGEVRNAQGEVVFTGIKEYESNGIDKWNITCAEGQDGQYIFTVDPETREITWELVKKLDPNSWTPAEKTYTLAGDETFCGVFWDAAAMGNNLKLNETTGLWTITFTNVLAGGYSFKICENNLWDVAYGDVNNPTDQNFAIKVEKDASTVIVTFNDVTKEITAKDAEGNDLQIKFDAVVSSGIVVVGSMNEWKAENAIGQYVLTLGEDGKTWTTTIKVETDVEIKLFDLSRNYGHDGGWIDSSEGQGENGNLKLSAGTYNIKYVAGDANFTCWKNGEDEPQNPGNTESGTLTETTEEITVYFLNNWLWTDVNCYCFTAQKQTLGNEWPGEEMTLVGTVLEGEQHYDVYSFKVPAGVAGIVINGIKDDNSGNRDQTPDIAGSNLVDGAGWSMFYNNGNTVNPFSYNPAE